MALTDVQQITASTTTQTTDTPRIYSIYTCQQSSLTDW